MNIFKSHFWYNKRQRNGIFFLLVLIIFLQLIYVFVDFSSDEKQDVNSPELIRFQKQIDSLKAIEILSKKPKKHPFNPNFISDFKGELLGMSLDEIDRLHAFRKKNKYVNSAREFQKVTKVSDSLLAKIAPSFKFPDWVVQREKRKASIAKKGKFSHRTNDAFSVQKISEEKINKLNVNTATFKQVLAIPEIDYELCKKIFDYRDEVAELQDISELKNIKDFPLEKYPRIIVYLTAE